MRTSFLTFLLITQAAMVNYGQQRAMTFQEAEDLGIQISYLDSIYKSAVNVDTSRAVFQSMHEQQMVGRAYFNLLQSLGQYLNTNNFYWEKPTRCFNRIYFNADGTIDYFLYNFTGKSLEEVPSDSLQIAFKQLLNEFIKSYQFEMKATTKFSQCAPAIYLPKKENNKK